MAERRDTQLRWVEDPSALRRRAAALVVGFAGLRESSRIAAIEAQFHDEQIFRVVFESNHIEGAGATSLTETRKIAAEAVSRRSSESMGRPERKLIVHRVWASERPDWPSIIKKVESLSEGVTPERYLPIVTFEERTRLGREVIQHAFEVQHTNIRAHRYAVRRMVYWAAQQHTWALRERGRAFDWPEEWPPKDQLGRPRLLDQSFVKKLHAAIADGLLDPAETGGITPGNYRIDRRVAGPLGRERWFTAPGQIEPSVRAWIRRANQLALELGVDPLFRACWIMHRFTEIHPVPDFNGRIARLLMNLSLTADGLPFPVSFPVGAKWRRRYASALYAGDRGSFEPLMTLVARAIVDAFDRLEAQLRAAGLRGIPEGKVGTYLPSCSPVSGVGANAARMGPSTSLLACGSYLGSPSELLGGQLTWTALC